MFDSVYKLLDQLGYPHPIHPAEVHIPIGLIVGALLFRLAAALFRQPGLEKTAYHCTILAGIFLFPTVLFGLMDWQHFYAGAWLFPIKIKMVLAAILIVLVFASIILAHKKGVGSGRVLLNYIGSFAAVVVLGYYGGGLVYGGAQPKTPETYLAGMNVFNGNCAGCHPNGGNIIDPSLPLLNSSKTVDINTFLAFIRDPKRPDGKPGAMPSFSPEKISDQEASELYKYIAHVLEKR
ncbi:MAG: cytochrome c [Gammaproteobacteria bacterium]|nr:cytochrome c [Gammaproteobacteria bacterium]